MRLPDHRHLVPALLWGLLACGSSTAPVAAEPPKSTEDVHPTETADPTFPSLDGAGKAALADARTLVVVVTPSFEATTGTLRVLVRDGDQWKVARAPVAASVGWGGLGWGRGLTSPPPDATRIKKEGDGAAPAGLFRVVRAMGEGATPPSGTSLPYTQAKDTTRCVDDPKSAFYNRIVELVPGEEPPFDSAEHMVRTDGLYKLLATVEHNGLDGDEPPVPGAGSCIFLHIGSGGPTAGCTAVSAEDMSGLLMVMSPPVLLVALPAPEYGKAVERWGLPSL